MTGDDLEDIATEIKSDKLRDQEKARPAVEKDKLKEYFLVKREDIKEFMKCIQNDLTRKGYFPRSYGNSGAAYFLGDSFIRGEPLVFDYFQIADFDGEKYQGLRILLRPIFDKRDLMQKVHHEMGEFSLPTKPLVTPVGSGNHDFFMVSDSSEHLLYGFYFKVNGVKKPKAKIGTQIHGKIVDYTDDDRDPFFQITGSAFDVPKELVPR